MSNFGSNTLPRSTLSPQLAQAIYCVKVFHEGATEQDQEKLLHSLFHVVSSSRFTNFGKFVQDSLMDCKFMGTSEVLRNLTHPFVFAKDGNNCSGWEYNPVLGVHAPDTIMRECLSKVDRLQRGEK